MVGTVPLDSLESFEESEVRKLARDRLRSSLKKGMMDRGDESRSHCPHHAFRGPGGTTKVRGIW